MEDGNGARLLGGSLHDAQYDETPSQIYDSASLEHGTIKNRRKSSLFRRKEPVTVAASVDFGQGVQDSKQHKGSDASSTSTASSDGTPGDHNTYDAVDALKLQVKDTPTPFLASALKLGPTLSVSKVISSRAQQTWRAIRGSKEIEVFLEQARYPSEVREPC